MTDLSSLTTDEQISVALLIADHSDNETLLSAAEGYRASTVASADVLVTLAAIVPEDGLREIGGPYLYGASTIRCRTTDLWINRYPGRYSYLASDAPRTADGVVGDASPVELLAEIVRRGGFAPQPWW